MFAPGQQREKGRKVHTWEACWGPSLEAKHTDVFGLQSVWPRLIAEEARKCVWLCPQRRGGGISGTAHFTDRFPPAPGVWRGQPCHTCLDPFWSFASHLRSERPTDLTARQHLQRPTLPCWRPVRAARPRPSALAPKAGLPPPAPAASQPRTPILPVPKDQAIKCPRVGSGGRGALGRLCRAMASPRRPHASPHPSTGTASGAFNSQAVRVARGSWNLLPLSDRAST